MAVEAVESNRVIKPDVADEDPFLQKCREAAKVYSMFGQQLPPSIKLVLLVRSCADRASSGKVPLWWRFAPGLFLAGIDLLSRTGTAG